MCPVVTMRGLRMRRLRVCAAQSDVDGKPAAARKKRMHLHIGASMSGEMLSCQAPARSVVFGTVVRKRWRVLQRRWIVGQSRRLPLPTCFHGNGPLW